jgi:hypothetical protein
VPAQKGDPQIQPASYSYTSGNTVVDQNANELWTVLVCKPWLDGELGTTAFSAPGAKPTPVNTYARQLLWAQAIAVNEKPTAALIQAKQATFTGIAQSIQQNQPGIYPLFQGKEWTTRLEIGFAALLAAVVAGVLVLLISVTLIMLKLSFLLLLIVGPFFLLIGVHPGFGRVVALRWVELLIGVLLKQAAIALVLSVLLYCYALIMGTSDAVLPWALKILMIALVTVAAFIYRKPFQHLFSAVGYGMIGSQERAELDLSRAGATARANTLAAATIAAPPFAAYRAGRWARRNPGQAASLAMAASSAGVGAAVASGLQAADTGYGAAAADGAMADGAAATAGAAAEGSGARMTLSARARAGQTQSAGTPEPPPLNLPSRGGSTAAGPVGAATSTTAALAPTNRAASGTGATPRTGNGTSPAVRAGNGAGPASPVPGPVPGVWPGGAGFSGPAASPPGRQRAAAPPRQPAPSQPAPRQPAPRQSASRQAAPSRSSPPSASPSSPPPSAPPRPASSQAAPPQSASPAPVAPQPVPSPRRAPAQPAPARQAPAGRMRDRWSAAASPARQASRPASRQGPPPPARGQSAAGGPEQGPQPSGSSGTWPGQPAAPLTPAEPQPERSVPFWLRPMRRK